MKSIVASSKNLAYNLDYESSYVSTSPKKQIEREYKKVCDIILVENRRLLWKKVLVNF